MVRLRSWVALHVLGRYLPALLLVVLAVADILTLVHPWGKPSGLAELFALDALGWGRAGIIISALIFLLVARAPTRGKRQAWLLSAGLIVFSFIADLTVKAALPTLLLLLGLLLTLLVLAPLFPARSDPHALARGYVALLLGLA